MGSLKSLFSPFFPACVNHCLTPPTAFSEPPSPSLPLILLCHGSNRVTTGSKRGSQSGKKGWRERCSSVVDSISFPTATTVTTGFLSGLPFPSTLFFNRESFVIDREQRAVVDWMKKGGSGDSLAKKRCLSRFCRMERRVEIGLAAQGGRMKRGTEKNEPS